MNFSRRILAISALGLAVGLTTAACASADGHGNTIHADRSLDASMMAQDKSEITAVLRSYESYVNDSNHEGLGSIYADDSILIPEGFDMFVGNEAITGFYAFAFSALTLNLEFNIDPDDIVIAGDVAYVTTDSTGTRLYKETNETVPEINRELWVFNRVDGTWKIARYCFNKTG